MKALIARLGENRIKRLADMSEKLGVGSMLVGVFQGVNLGLYLGFACLIFSMGATKKTGDNQ